MDKQNNTQTEVLSYEKSKIELLLNILNNLQFTGIQQAQGITQVSFILNQPISKDAENIDE